MEAGYSHDDVHKKSSDAYLFIRGIIDSGGKNCTLFSPICMILFGNYAIIPFILSPPQCKFLEKMDLGEMFDTLGEHYCGGGLTM